MPNKVWFITGASRGFGRVWADAALQRGDQVAATARTVSSIADLKEKYGVNVLTLELDVTKPEQVKTAVAQAHAHFGRLDVVLIMPAIHLSARLRKPARTMFELFMTRTSSAHFRLFKRPRRCCGSRAGGTSWAYRAPLVM